MGSLAEVIGVHLPTPTASDTKGAAQREGRMRDGRLRSDSDERLAGAVARFLPTPTASDADKARDNPAQAKRKSPPISAVSQYFPTPRTTDANGPGRHGTGGPDLRTVIAEFSGEPMPPLFDVGNV
jgi:DNA (cytosine-5)-methyltransferase 1